LTVKQSWSRARNVQRKAAMDTELGEKSRRMLYSMTREKKYQESAFKKRFESGKHYSLKEIRSSLALAKKRNKARIKLGHKTANDARVKRGMKKMSRKEFLEANPHYADITEQFDEIEIEWFYDS